jgi:hypothetical protein
VDRIGEFVRRGQIGDCDRCEGRCRALGLGSCMALVAGVMFRDDGGAGVNKEESIREVVVIQHTALSDVVPRGQTQARELTAWAQ